MIPTLLAIALLALGAVGGFALAMAWVSLATLREAQKGGWLEE